MAFRPAMPPPPHALAASPRHGEWVTVAWEPGSADSLMAWVRLSGNVQREDTGVIVVHEIFGLSTMGTRRR